MAVTAHVFTSAIAKAFNKEIDLDSDTIKVMLTTSTFVPNADSQVYKSSVTNEVTGTGYTAGGITLASKTVNSSSGVFTFDAADVTWASSTITARNAVIYDSTGTDSTSALIAWVAFGSDVSSTAGPFTISWDPTGILIATVS